LHLEKFGYKAVFIGFAFAIPTLIYASTSPLIYVLTSRLKKSAVIFLGYGILTLGLLFVGPSKLLGLYNSPAFIILGLAIMGFGCGLIIIPVMPEMIEAVEQAYPNIEQDELHNNISGLFIAFQGIGETAGPILGSVLDDMYGFRTANDVMGSTVFTFMILFFLFCGRMKMFKTDKASLTVQVSEDDVKNRNDTSVTPSK